MNSLSKFFSHISRYFRSARDSIPIGILCISASDIMLPDQVLSELREYGILEYIDDELSGDGLHPSMKQLLDSIRSASELGNIDPVSIRVENMMNSLSAKLEKSEMNIERLLDSLSMFTTVLQLMIASTLILTANNPNILLYIALLGLVFSFLPLASFPLELGMKSNKYLLILSIVPATFVVYPYLDFDPLLLLTLLSISGSIYALKLLIADRKIRHEVIRVLELASGCPDDIYACIGLDGEELVRRLGGGIVAHGVNMLALYGGDREHYLRLKDYVLRVNGFIEKIRGKGMVYLFYSLVSAVICAAAYSLIFEGFRGILPEQVSFAGIGITIDFSVVRIVELVLSINSLSLAFLTANAREGNSLFYVLYLPVICLASWLGWVGGSIFAPYLLGV